MVRKRASRGRSKKITIYIKQHANKKEQQATPGLASQPQDALTDEQLKGVMGGAKKIPPGPAQMQPDPTAVQ